MITSNLAVSNAEAHSSDLERRAAAHRVAAETRPRSRSGRAAKPRRLARRVVIAMLP